MLHLIRRLVVLFAIFWLAGCGTTVPTPPAAQSLAPAQIDVTELKQMLDRQEAFVLLDVRTPEEFAQDGRISQAQLIPVDQLAARLNELPTDQPIVCICRSGNRSQTACELLAREGFEAINVQGGMRAWITAGYAVE